MITHARGRNPFYRVHELLHVVLNFFRSNVVLTIALCAAGLSMVLVPPEGYDMQLLDRCKRLLAPAGFGKLSVTTAEEHDRMIAFTSQMCHVVSNAYIKSPTARSHRGFSAGSYKDLTRVAKLNADMWAELMLENRDFMLQEMDVLIENLQAYRKAMAENDFEDLRQLLQEGKEIKEAVDGR